jgi:hypothetical protein
VFTQDESIPSISSAPPNVLFSFGDVNTKLFNSDFKSQPRELAGDPKVTCRKSHKVFLYSLVLHSPFAFCGSRGTEEFYNEGDRMEMVISSSQFSSNGS